MRKHIQNIIALAMVLLLSLPCRAAAPEDSLPIVIGAMAYTSGTLNVGSTENLQVEFSGTAQRYWVEVYQQMEDVLLLLTAGYVTIPEDTSTVTIDFPILFQEAGDFYTVIQVFPDVNGEMLTQRTGQAPDTIFPMCTQAGDFDFQILFDQTMHSDGAFAEACASEIGRAFDADATGLLTALAGQPEEVRLRVMEHLLYVNGDRDQRAALIVKGEALLEADSLAPEAAGLLSDLLTYGKTWHVGYAFPPEPTQEIPVSEPKTQPPTEAPVTAPPVTDAPTEPVQEKTKKPLRNWYLLLIPTAALAVVLRYRKKQNKKVRRVPPAHTPCCEYLEFPVAQKPIVILRVSFSGISQRILRLVPQNGNRIWIVKRRRGF